MLEAPVGGVTFECGLHTIIDPTSNLKIEVEGNRKLTGQVFFELDLNENNLMIHISERKLRTHTVNVT